MGRSYKNIVFTKHAAERTALRSISDDAVWNTITFPDKVQQESHQSKRYIKLKNGRKYFVIATYLPQESKYLIVSTWVRGEDDAQPLAWVLISLPFKLVWRLSKYLISKIGKI